MNKCWSFARMVSGVSAIVLGTALVSSAQETGVKQIQELIKSANTSVKSINDTKLQLEKTMAAYNTVLSPDVKDRQDAYKKLQKEMENLRRQLVSVEELRAKMRENGIERWEEVHKAYMEPDGEISVLRRESRKESGDEARPAGSQRRKPL